MGPRVRGAPFQLDSASVRPRRVPLAGRIPPQVASFRVSLHFRSGCAQPFVCSGAGGAGWRGIPVGPRGRAGAWAGFAGSAPGERAGPCPCLLCSVGPCGCGPYRCGRGGPARRSVERLVRVHRLVGRHFCSGFHSAVLADAGAYPYSRAFFGDAPCADVRSGCDVCVVSYDRAGARAASCLYHDTGFHTRVVLDLHPSPDLGVRVDACALAYRCAGSDRRRRVDLGAGVDSRRRHPGPGRLLDRRVAGRRDRSSLQAARFPPSEVGSFSDHDLGGDRGSPSDETLGLDCRSGPYVDLVSDYRAGPYGRSGADTCSFPD